MARTVESFTKEEKKKEGWLTKRGSLAKTWKLRYFILTADCLYYFKAPTTEENQSNGGSGDFLACLNLDEYNSIADTTIKGKDHCFCLFHNEDKGTRSLIMSATSKEEKDEWVTTIQMLLQRRNIPRITVENSRGFFDVNDDQIDDSNIKPLPSASFDNDDNDDEDDTAMNGHANSLMNGSKNGSQPTAAANRTLSSSSSSSSLSGSPTSPPGSPSISLASSPSPSVSSFHAITPSSSSTSLFKGRMSPSPATSRSSASKRYPTFDPFTDEQKLLMNQLPDNEFARAKLVPPTSKTDAMYKVILVGDSGVGKTNLIRVFNGEPFKSNIVATVGADFISKTYALPDDLNVKVQIWDTAGQERYHSVMKAYYRGCTGALIVFDVNQRPTYERVEYWLKELEVNCNSEVLVVGIIGNKADLDSSLSSSGSSAPTSTAVPLQEAAAMALSQEMFFVDTSAYNGKNVHKAFLTLFQEIHDVVNKRRKSRSHTLASDINGYTVTPSNPQASFSTNTSTSSSCVC